MGVGVGGRDGHRGGLWGGEGWLGDALGREDGVGWRWAGSDVGFGGLRV